MSLTRQQWDDLMRRAEAGDAEAQWEVGSWLEDGITSSDGTVVVRRNTSLAVRWYRRSAEAGNASAQVNLGNCLSTGRSARRNDAEALRWYKRALRQGSAIAPRNIATVYRDHGNLRRAMFWYKRAVACGDGDALAEVGERLYMGIGVRRDADEAVICFRKAIASKNITQAGREDAMFRLGVAYHEGQGVRQSMSLALKWLSLSNRDGDRPEAEALIITLKRKRRRTSASTATNQPRRRG